MGIHTSIYRERDVRPEGREKYEIKLFRGNEEVKLENPVMLREEFYFGKSVWAINEWFYRWKINECEKWGEKPDEDLSYECINEECIYLSDLKKLLRDVRKALKEPEKAEEILPMPKDLKLVRPKKEYYDEKEGAYVMRADDEWDEVPREETYDEYYFDSLKRAEKLLEQIIREDGEDSICEYIVDVG